MKYWQLPESEYIGPLQLGVSSSADVSQHEWDVCVSRVALQYDSAECANQVKEVTRLVHYLQELSNIVPQN